MEILVLFIAVLAFWYCFQKIAQFLLLRRAIAFCPQCFSGYLQPASRPQWATLFPFILIFQCHDCGLHFMRGRKPPFATCPSCRGTMLQPAETNPGVWRGTIRRLLGTRYTCRHCTISFSDHRQTRAEFVKQQSAGRQSN